MIVKHIYGRLMHEVHQDIIKQKNRLEMFKYDDFTTKRIEQKISDGYELIRLMDKENPMHKLHEYGGAWKCPKCEVVVVNQYAKYCHYCGQRFVIKDESIQGWNAEK